MGADVKLVGQQTRVEAWDLVLDATDRRTSTDGDRRALVHDGGDALTINYANDYPGGVRIHGATHIDGVRVIEKDAGWIAPLAIVGGVSVEGGLLVKSGSKLVLSDENPTDDFANGEVYQSDSGLHIEGGTPKDQPSKAVDVNTLVAHKALHTTDGITRRLTGRREHRLGPVRRGPGSVLRQVWRATVPVPL